MAFSVQMPALGESVTEGTVTRWLKQEGDTVERDTVVPAGCRRTVSGRFLLDPRGAKTVVRGVEQVFWDAGWLRANLPDEIAKTGANTIRLLPYITRMPPNGD